ncbi:GNAT family N-acetyltransferase [Catenuloplanes japonicus]|uniref:GNAT family N-acetyltransferase n=1 Tax=Catenuloplanes japonicus TaxID=33876 RepID=UPI0005249C84|nr:GNAT family N-acetyltransferase [Catenuloplanes japonicus]
MSSLPSEPNPALRLVAARAGSDAVEQAIRLGNTARSTLGHLAFAVYDDAAAKGCLRVAYQGERAVAYALYGLGRGRVRLTHLCVDEKFRGHGFARILVDDISQRHAEYRGILVRCRHDYGLAEMWISLGFTSIGEKAGRGRDREPIVEWWRDHGHPNLFTVDAETVLVRAAIDLNILRDLAESARGDREDSLSLLSDQMAGRLELVRTAALDREIATMNGDLRARCSRTAQPFPSVRADGTFTSQLRAQLTVEGKKTHPDYPRNANDRFDLAHVADAAASGVKVLITKDSDLTRTLGPAAADHGVRILRPSDVVVHLDELERAESYRPVDLLATGYVRHLIGSGHDDSTAVLANRRGGESPKHLLQAMRKLALGKHDRIGVYGPDGSIDGLYGLVTTPDKLVVPLLRVTDAPIGDTLARQLLFLVRQQARDAGRHVVRITDGYASSQVRSAALTDGFVGDGQDLVAYVLPAVGTAGEVEHQAVVAARRAGLIEPATLRSGMPSLVASELERAWWPAKIIDSRLPTYLLPIQQAYSADLLGVPAGLLPRQNHLGLNREHVYYRSPRGLRFSAPARLLWYMSATGPTTAAPPGVVACSALDSVVEGSPDDLHSRFRHLGVWDRSSVWGVAREQRAQALRFTNTEILARPVPRRRLADLLRQHGLAAQAPQGPMRVPAALFAAIYREGVER